MNRNVNTFEYLKSFSHPTYETRWMGMGSGYYPKFPFMGLSDIWAGYSSNDRSSSLREKVFNLYGKRLEPKGDNILQEHPNLYEIWKKTTYIADRSNRNINVISSAVVEKTDSEPCDLLNQMAKAQRLENHVWFRCRNAHSRSGLLKTGFEEYYRNQVRRVRLDGKRIVDLYATVRFE